MAGIGFNPRYGWDSRLPYLQGDAFGFGYNWLPVYDAFIPPPPPGFAWFDVGGVGVPWCAPFPQQWNPYSQDPGNQCTANGGGEGGIPGVNFRNAYGGTGMEPGYNYIFPPNHCKIHVIVSAQPPWQNAGGPFLKKCFNVPTGITVKELMQQFGCNNPDPARNKLYEMSQGADGRWYKGVTLSGDDNEKMEKKIEEIGWNTRRNGIDQDFVWLYFTKD